MTENKKYELVKDDFIDISSKLRLFRVKALAAFRFVEAGDLGGYIKTLLIWLKKAI